jgi:hypothetical protein
MSCGEDREYAPSNCVRSKPSKGSLKVRCTINAEYPLIPITVYLGDFEEDQVMLRDTVDIPIVLYELPVDEYYSVAAEYRSEEDTLIVLRGARISTMSRDYEDATCWSVLGAEVDCRLP